MPRKDVARDLFEPDVCLLGGTSTFRRQTSISERQVLLAVNAMGGESSDAWPSVLNDLIGRGFCRPVFPDRCPKPDGDACQFVVQNPAGSRPGHRCTINMYLICMCWLRGGGTAKTGRDRGRPLGGSDSTMNDYKINKVLGVVLGTALFLQAVHIIDGALTPKIAKAAAEGAAKEEQPAAGGQSLDSLLASASAEHGAQIAKQCQICHNLQEGQGPKIGPDLYGVVDRPVATAAGFNYTPALKAKGGKWTFAALNKWLTDPRADVPGTAMTFAGLSSDKQRADVIAYLDTLSKSPVPLPKAK